VAIVVIVSFVNWLIFTLLTCSSPLSKVFLLLICERICTSGVLVTSGCPTMHILFAKIGTKNLGGRKLKPQVNIGFNILGREINK